MMKIYTLTVLLVFAGITLSGQDLAVQTFGDKTDTPVLFLHGGPGYNSVAFESTTAAELANNGFYVISYDRRGEGRNEALTADFTFQQSITDINMILTRYDLEKVNLIGHSFGGVLATKFTTAHPEKVNALILVSSPISMQETLKNIVTSSKAIYAAKQDQSNLTYIAMLEKMDASSLEYSSYAFMHAMSNGFYTTKNPNERAKALYTNFSTDSLLQKYASKMDYRAPQGFWKNDRYTTIDLSQELEQLKKSMAIYALYGKDDGLFSPQLVENAVSILGKDQVRFLDDCSHSVFIDRQELFIDSIKEWAK